MLGRATSIALPHLRHFSLHLPQSSLAEAVDDGVDDDQDHQAYGDDDNDFDACL